MSVAIPSSSNVAMPPQILMRRWTVEEYHKMIQAGVFAHDEKFELLGGWIVPKMSRNPPHDASLDQAHEEVRKRLPTGWRVRVQSAITTPDSEPEPDLAIVRGEARTYSSRHPCPADIALIIEIADSSLLEDHRDKARIYARAAIAVYWIINLVDSQVEVHTRPSGPGTIPAYPGCRVFSVGEMVPFQIDGIELETIPVRDLLS
jgi:Uma2 family endonuclease